jgi:hypothetical protein
MAMLARLRWLFVAAVLGSLVGFLVSYLFNPRYSASAVLQVHDPSLQCRGCGLPDKSVSQRKLANYLQQVFFLNNLRPLIERERIASPEDVGKVYWETHKKTKLQVDGFVASPVPLGENLDLIYTDSTPQRAEGFCSLLTSAILERTRVDQEAANEAFMKAARGPLGAISIIGQPPQPYGVDVMLPCAEGTRDFSHAILCAAIGSAVGLLFGIALVAARRNSLHRVVLLQR